MGDHEKEGKAITGNEDGKESFRPTWTMAPVVRTTKERFHGQMKDQFDQLKSRDLLDADSKGELQEIGGL